VAVWGTEGSFKPPGWSGTRVALFCLLYGVLRAEYSYYFVHTFSPPSVTGPPDTIPHSVRKRTQKRIQTATIWSAGAPGRQACERWADSLGGIPWARRAAAGCKRPSAVARHGGAGSGGRGSRGRGDEAPETALARGSLSTPVAAVRRLGRGLGLAVLLLAHVAPRPAPIGRSGGRQSGVPQRHHAAHGHPRS